MASKTHYEAARTRLIVAIRFALQHQNFEVAHQTLQIAFSEFPGDAELESIQHEFSQCEHAALVASTLFRHGCRRIRYGDYESGIDKLRRAIQMSPMNRDFQTKLFDSLTHFATIVVDRDPELARRLLQEASQISPLNLQVEKTASYLSGRIRQRMVEQCLTCVEELRSRGLYHEALKQVVGLENQFHVFAVPALERMRQDLLWDVATRTSPVSIQTILHPRTPTPPPIQTMDHEAQVPDTVPTPPPTPQRRFRSKIQDGLRDAQQSAVSSMQSVQGRMRDRWNRAQSRLDASSRHVHAAMARIQLRSRLRARTQSLSAILDSYRSRALEWRRAGSFSFVSLKAYPAATGAVCLVLVFAAVMIGRSTGSPPTPNTVGTAKLLLPVTLFREPAAGSGVSGSVDAGQQVDLLQQIPAESLDAWALVRTTGDKNAHGYVKLRNLDAVQTTDLQFNLWYAMSFLDRSTSRREFRNRVESLERMVKASAPGTIQDFNRMEFVFAKSFARLASEGTNDPKTSRQDLEKSEFYLNQVHGPLLDSREVDALRWSIQTTRASLEAKEAPDGPIDLSLSRVTFFLP